MHEEDVVRPWREHEITLCAEQRYGNGYTDVEVWAEFTHDSGLALRRPAFWDGERTWKIRFASPLAEGHWTWRSFSSTADAGLAGQSGVLTCAPAGGETNRFWRHGFWRMSPGKRSLVHADGRAAVLAGDTAWGLPWRATHAQCRVYAADRQAKGFNAVLLMSVQPDMEAQGPRERSAAAAGLSWLWLEGAAHGGTGRAAGRICPLLPVPGGTVRRTPGDLPGGR
jgi:hypothetical protein